MSETAKKLFIVFLVMAFGGLAHDLYIWQTSDGHPFNFAALGWVIKHYASQEQDAVVQTIGADIFNTILTPILKIPVFFFGSFLAVLTYVIDLAKRKISTNSSGATKKAKDFPDRYRK